MSLNISATTAGTSSPSPLPVSARTRRAVYETSASSCACVGGRARSNLRVPSSPRTYTPSNVSALGGDELRRQRISRRQDGRHGLLFAEHREADRLPPHPLGSHRPRRRQVARESRGDTLADGFLPSLLRSVTLETMPTPAIPIRRLHVKNYRCLHDVAVDLV